MNANELRVGNKFDYHGQTVWVMKIAITWAEFGYFTDSVGFERAFDDEDFPKPIPITPEILTRWLGFIEKHTPTFSGGFDFFMKFIEQPDTKGTYSTRKLTISDKSNFVFLNDNFIARCNFLHELQNLIFALVGKELEIKIPEMK